MFNSFIQSIRKASFSYISSQYIYIYILLNIRKKHPWDTPQIVGIEHFGYVVALLPLGNHCKVMQIFYFKKIIKGSTSFCSQNSDTYKVFYFIHPSLLPFAWNTHFCHNLANLEVKDLERHKSFLTHIRLSASFTM